MRHVIMIHSSLGSRVVRWAAYIWYGRPGDISGRRNG